MDLNSVIKRPSPTEKSLRMMESENTLIFVVDKKAKKQEIKQAFESMFKAKVANLRTHITNKGEKKVFVRFNMETPAIDIATQLGLI